MLPTFSSELKKLRWLVDPYPSSLTMTQNWSWRVYASILALALSTAVCLVYSPWMWLGIAALLVVAAQFMNPISSLGIVVFSCGLLSYSPFEAGLMSRLYPGDLAIAIFVVAWL